MSWYHARFRLEQAIWLGTHGRRDRRANTAQKTGKFQCWLRKWRNGMLGDHLMRVSISCLTRLQDIWRIMLCHCRYETMITTVVIELHEEAHRSPSHVWRVAPCRDSGNNRQTKQSSQKLQFGMVRRLKILHIKSSTTVRYSCRGIRQCISCLTCTGGNDGRSIAIVRGGGTQLELAIK